LDDFRAPSSALLSYSGRKAELPGCNAQLGTLNDTAKIIAALPGLANTLQRAANEIPL
jgi:hypothetical protein